jgi:VHL beta domain
MLYRPVLAVLLLTAAPAFADSDEISPVPLPAVLGHPYLGERSASQIRFINVRTRAVSIVWIGFDGVERPYASLDPGGEIVQPTFVGHRWLIRDKEDGQPLEAFISTRSAIRDRGTAQIALIR